MNCIGTYDGTIFYNPANKFCIISVKTADQSVPAEARSNRRYKDHLIRFTAVGYEIPRTDAVELELDGEWAKGKYGVQLQVEQWREIVPRTKNGVEGYLASGLIKGIGPKTAADIVERFGVDTLDILEHQPERLVGSLDADALIILTAVEKVAINFGKPDQKWLDHLTPEEARQYEAEGQFAPGSMLPKVQAAVKFAASKPGRTALITLLEKAKDGIAGKTGTAVSM